jgi:hypothetical protein
MAPGYKARLFSNKAPALRPVYTLLKRYFQNQNKQEKRRSVRPFGTDGLRLFAAAMRGRHERGFIRRPKPLTGSTRRGEARRLKESLTMFVVFFWSLMEASFRFACRFRVKALGSGKLVGILRCEGGRGERERIGREIPLRWISRCGRNDSPS